MLTRSSPFLMPTLSGIRGQSRKGKKSVGPIAPAPAALSSPKAQPAPSLVTSSPSDLTTQLALLDDATVGAVRVRMGDCGETFICQLLSCI